MALLDDTCCYCNHPLKVADRTWERVKSHYAMPICANYCDEKTCKEENCELKCEEIALATPEGEHKMLLEVVRRKRKLERLEAEELKELKAADVQN